jgi:hypothetical protein
MSNTRVGRPGYTLLATATMSRLADNTPPVALVLLVAAFTVPTLIAGPAVVAAFAGALGATAGFAALVAITVAGVPLVLVAPMPAPAALASGPPAAESLAAAIADGLRLLRRSRELLSVTVATTGAQFFQGPLPVVLPLLAVLAVGQLLCTVPLLSAHAVRPRPYPIIPNECVVSPDCPVSPETTISPEAAVTAPEASGRG